MQYFSLDLPPEVLNTPPPPAPGAPPPYRKTQHVVYQDEPSWQRARERSLGITREGAAAKKGDAEGNVWFMQTFRVPDSFVEASHAFTQAPVHISSQYTGIFFMWLHGDVQRMILEYLSTPDLKLISLSCKMIWLKARGVLDIRLKKFPVHNEIHLNDKQQYVLRMAVRNFCNLCIQGAAGTGKSLLLRTIYHQLTFKAGKRVYVIAPTGIAALNVGGMTIHEFLGIGAQLPTRDELLDMVIHNRNNVKRVRLTDVIILDEMSMVSAQMFGLLKMALELFRGNEMPCGGVQMIFMGDLAQLSPVPDEHKTWDSSAYCIEHKQWNSVFGPAHGPRVVCLTQAMRQDSDMEFLALLNHLRTGKDPGPHIKELLYDRHIQNLRKRGETIGSAMHLMPLREQVSAYNKAQLEQLSSHKSCLFPTICVWPRVAQAHLNMFMMQGIVYVQYHQQLDQEIYDFLEKRKLLSRIPVELREGARVLLTKNFAAHRLSNGNTGIIKRMLDLKDDALEIFYLLEGNRQASSSLKGHRKVERVQLLCDNFTELCMNCNPPRRRGNLPSDPMVPIPAGQGPVFRICQKDDMESTHSCASHISNPLSGRAGVLPLVEFDSQPNIWYLVMPQTQSYYRPGPVIVEGPHTPGAWLDDTDGLWKAIRSTKYASVLNMPLELCYSATMHRIQGLTLSRVSMSLSECWDPSQVYTALSRVRRLRDVCITSMPNWFKLYGDTASTARRQFINCFLTTVEAKVLQKVDEALDKKKKRTRVEEALAEEAKKPKPVERPPVPVALNKDVSRWMEL